MANRFQKLLEPGYIGKVRTKNRMVKMGAHHGYYPYNDGYVDERCYGFYEALARGGIGLITVQHSEIDFRKGMVLKVGFRFDDDKYIKGQSKFAEISHKYNCPVFMELMHSGPHFRGQQFGLQPLAASSIPQNEMPKPTLEVAHEMTIAEIEEMVDKFINAGLRAQKAGFDGIVLNAGFSHFLNSFLSRAWNRRQDAYGGSLENRAKIMVDILQGIKKRAGQDFAVIALFNSAEIRLKDGITPEEGQGIARIMEKAGADAIHTRAEYYLRPGVVQCESTHIPDIVFYPEPLGPVGENIDGSQHGKGAWIPMAAGIKKVVSIPVIGIGRLDPLHGEKLLSRGMVDFIAMNRRLFADPEISNKVASGKLEDIVPCTGCMTCWEAGMTYKAATCQVNTAFGIEKEYEMKPAAKKKRVVIIGGGPAGLETAMVAALRGHSVILCEKESKLGGSMNVATVVKGVGKEDLPSLIRYFQIQLGKLGVDIRLGKEVNRAVIDEIKPDVLVIASGGTHNVPNISGINRRNVVTSRDLHLRLKKYLKFFGPLTLRRLTNVWMPIGKKVVVMGGNIQGCQVAEFLVKRGRQVTIVEPGKEIGEGLLTAYMKPLLLNWLSEKGVTMIAGAKFEEVSDKGLTITTKEGNRQTLEADTIVTALPLLPNNELAKSLSNAAPETYSIGDCQEPAMIVNAIAAGSRVARAF